jgi:hypothetical protein
LYPVDSWPDERERGTEGQGEGQGEKKREKKKKKRERRREMKGARAENRVAYYYLLIC